MESNFLNGIRKQTPKPNSDAQADMRRLEEEKAVLFQKLEQTLLKSRGLRERLVELDVTKNIEISDLKREISGLKNVISDISEDKETLLGENEMLLGEISEKEKKASSALRMFEANRLQFLEFRDELAGAAERLRAWEAKYKGLEEKHEGLKSLNRPLSGDANAAFEENSSLKKEISGLKSALDENERSILSLKNSLSHINSLNEKKQREAEERLVKEREKTMLLEAAISGKNNRIRELEDGLSKKEQIERDYEKAREDLEGAFKHRANEMKAVRDAYEAEIEKLRNENDAVKRELKAAADGTGAASSEREEAVAQIEKERARNSALLDALSEKDRTIEDILKKHSALKEEIEDALKEKAGLSGLLETERANAESLSDSLAGMYEEMEKRQADFRKYHEREMGWMREENEKLEVQLQRKSREAEGLLESIGRLDAGKKAAEDALSGLKEDMDDRVGSALSEKAGAEFLLSEERARVAALEASLSEKEIAYGQMQEVLSGFETLKEENEGLRRELEEAGGEDLKFRKLNDSLSSGMRRIEERFDAFVERMEKREADYSGSVEALHGKFSEMSGKMKEALEGAERGRHETFKPADGMQPVKALPFGLSPGKVFVGKVLLGLLVAVFLFGMTAGLLEYATETAPPPAPVIEETPRQAENIWASGLKRSKEGGFDVSLTFLNREALGVLGYSEMLSDEELGASHYALLEIKAEEGCIGDGFRASFIERVSFLDAEGNRFSPVLPPSLSEKGRTVFKEKACGAMPGAVMMKEYLSFGKGHDVSAMAISGISEEAPEIMLR